MEIRNLVFEFSRVTEAAAIAAHKYSGRNNKNKADQAAVSAMRNMLNMLPIDGEIVIGEGELDDAPMLYNGEKVGTGGIGIDIAVDPVDGTTDLSKGGINVISVIAAAKKGSLFKAPDMYMLKVATSQDAFDAIDIDKSLSENIKSVAKALNKDTSEIGVAIIDRERSLPLVEEAHALGCRVFRFGDGDITKAILTCIPESDIDIFYGVGGAPEGVLAAAAIKALGGNMQGKLTHYDQVWDDEDAERITTIEKEKLDKIGIQVDQKLTINDLVQGDDYIFSATGITHCELVEGVVREGKFANTDTILLRGKTNTRRKIVSVHCLEKKNDELKELFL